VAGDDILLDCVGDGDPTPKTKWTRIGPGLPPDGLVLDLPNYKVWRFFKADKNIFSSKHTTYVCTYPTRGVVNFYNL
jgi:hypothetical protein